MRSRRGGAASKTGGGWRGRFERALPGPSGRGWRGGGAGAETEGRAGQIQRPLGRIWPPGSRRRKKFGPSRKFVPGRALIDLEEVPIQGFVSALIEGILWVSLLRIA